MLLAINKIYQIEKHTLIHILSGDGSIQVDFNNYYDWHDKAIFLEKGQYIKFLSDNFVVRKYEFFDEDKFYNNEVRVLFKHLKKGDNFSDNLISKRIKLIYIFLQVFRLIY